MKAKLYLPLVVALLCVFLWATYARATRTPVRQAWEYKSLIYTYKVQGPTPPLFYEDGRQLSGSFTPVSRAPELGADGWELVSVTGTMTYPESVPTATYVYWFKRPK